MPRTGTKVFSLCKETGNKRWGCTLDKIIPGSKQQAKPYGKG